MSHRIEARISKIAPFSRRERMDIPQNGEPMPNIYISTNITPEEIQKAWEKMLKSLKNDPYHFLVSEEEDDGYTSKW